MICATKHQILSCVVVAHAFDPSTSSEKSTWPIELVPGQTGKLHCEIMSQQATHKYTQMCIYTHLYDNFISFLPIFVYLIIGLVNDLELLSVPLEDMGH